MSSLYVVNKGVSAPVVFKGLQAQYIWWMAGGLVIVFILFATLYVIGIPSLICVGIAFVAGIMLVVKIYRLSSRYGQYGLMKIRAWRMLPSVIKNHSRSVFIK